MGVTPSPLFQDGLALKANNNVVTGANPVGLNNILSDALSLSQATSQTVTGPLVLSGGSANNMTIGATTPSTGAFTTLATTGAVSSVIPATITWSGSTPTSNSPSLFTSLVHNGTTTSSSGVTIYDWNINGDRIAMPSSGAASIGYQFTHIYGGGTGGVGGATNCVGSRCALQVNLDNESATNTDAVLGVSPFLVAAGFFTQIGYNEGGTSNIFPGKGRGAAFATNPVCVLESGATNYLTCAGEEINVAIVSGASAQEKVGLQIVKVPTDVVQGGNGYDVAIKIADAEGAGAPWNYGIMLGHPSAQWPFSSTSSLIAAFESQNNLACLANYGVDFRSAIFTTAAFASIGFKIDGSGNATFGNDIQLGNFKFQTAAAGLVIDANDQTALTVAINTGGTGWTIGDKFTTATGGVYKVTTVSSGVATGVSQLVPDISASPPSNPISTTATNNNIFRTGGSGLTLNLTWTASNLLSLSPSGGLTAIGGAFAINTRVVTASGAVTMLATDRVIVVNKTTGAATTVNLLSSPTTGLVVSIKDGKGDAQTNPISIVPASGTIDGLTSILLDTAYASITLIYNGSAWNVIS